MGVVEGVWFVRGVVVLGVMIRLRPVMKLMTFPPTVLTSLASDVGNTCLQVIWVERWGGGRWGGGRGGEGERGEREKRGKERVGEGGGEIGREGERKRGRERERGRENESTCLANKAVI